MRRHGCEWRVPSEQTDLFDRADADAAAGMGRRTLGLTNASDKSNVSARALELTRPFPEPIVQLIPGLKALASPTRLKVLELLRDPAAFDGPRDAAGQPLGVTAKALLKHFRIAQPSFNEQMDVLIGIGLVEATKVGRWTVYKRDEERIRQLKQTIIDQLLPPG
jgi:DNA-binding transcriptional ArsR family regulator